MNDTGHPISKFEFQEGSFQFDSNTDRLLEFIVDQKGNITGFTIQREVEDVTPDGPGPKWKEMRFTGRKTITIEILTPHLEKQSPKFKEMPAVGRPKESPGPNKPKNTGLCQNCDPKEPHRGQVTFTCRKCLSLIICP